MRIHVHWCVTTSPFLAKHGGWMPEISGQKLRHTEAPHQIVVGNVRFCVGHR